MKIDKIKKVENYVVSTYPQFKAIIDGIPCYVIGVYYNGGNLDEIECINIENDNDIFDTLPIDIQNEIENILTDILGDKNNLTYL